MVKIMKIVLDGEEILTLNEFQKKVIKNEIPDEIFEEDVKRRLRYILLHKYEQCLKHLKEEWYPKLKESGTISFPMQDEAFAELVLSHKDYKSRSERDILVDNTKKISV